MIFEYVLMPTWPRLAWLARCTIGVECVRVMHGAGIDVFDEWFCEAVWAGSFNQGGFDLTDIVAGTGGRIRSRLLTFVSSGSTLDRLQSHSTETGIWVSNSLACLMAAIDGSVDPTYAQYDRDIGTIINGLPNYKRDLLTSNGPVRLTYFNNLVWDTRTLTELSKPGGTQDFSTFESYWEFMSSSMHLLSENLIDGDRRFAYRMLATVSSGYDSPTVATLARKYGCEDALCFDEGRGGVEEKGADIARFLGLRPVVFSREAWRSVGTLAEAPFIVADGIGMDLPFNAAETVLSGRVLLTGFHGDKIWSKKTDDVSEHLVRGDRSGLSLSEFRLSTGFIHCPVTFWGVRQIRDVVAISTSEKMRNWDVSGAYSRPICRRIVEEAGVPREVFGVRKAAVAVLLRNSPHSLSAKSLTDFRAWLRANAAQWSALGKRRPLAIPLLDSAYWAANQAASQAARYVLRVARGKPLIWRLRGVMAALWRLAEASHASTKLVGFRQYFFAWALERTKRRYEMP